MSKVIEGQQGDPLAGMEEGAVVHNDAMKAFEPEVPQSKPEDEPVDDAGEPPAQEAVATEGEDGAGEDTAAAEGEKPKKKGKTAAERISEKTAQVHERDRRIAELERQITVLTGGKVENSLQDENSGGNIPESGTPKPDATDLQKYPLGDLDPAYVEDLTDWKVDQKIRTDRQRQADEVAQADLQRRRTDALGKVADITEKGLALQDDYEETVVQPFLRGELPLEEATFLAASEAEHGAEILRDLAANPIEALQIALLHPVMQKKEIEKRNAEIAARSKPRLPQAPPPPQSQPRGTGGRFGIRGDVESIDDIEKFLYGRG